MSFTVSDYIPDAVCRAMARHVNTGLLKKQTSPYDQPEILAAFLDARPQFVPLFRCCRFGTDGSNNLLFEQIPERPNYTLSLGWHVGLGNELAAVLRMSATITHGPHISERSLVIS